MKLEMPLKLKQDFFNSDYKMVVLKTNNGGKKTIYTNVRIVAATHRNLFDMINDGLFIKVLILIPSNVVPINVPALRDRI